MAVNLEQSGPTDKTPILLEDNYVELGLSFNLLVSVINIILLILFNVNFMIKNVISTISGAAHVEDWNYLPLIPRF